MVLRLELGEAVPGFDCADTEEIKLLGTVNARATIKTTFRYLFSLLIFTPYRHSTCMSRILKEAYDKFVSEK